MAISNIQPFGFGQLAIREIQPMTLTIPPGLSSSLSPATSSSSLQGSNREPITQGYTTAVPSLLTGSCYTGMVLFRFIFGPVLLTNESF